MVLAKRDFNLRGRELADTNAQFIAFSATTRMSGVDLDGRKVRKGAGDSIIKFVRENGGQAPADLDGIVQKISTRWRNATGRRRHRQGDGRHLSEGHHQSKESASASRVCMRWVCAP